MRRLFVVFLIPTSAIIGLFLLFSLFNTVPASASATLPGVREQQASGSAAGEISSMIKPDTDLSAAAPLATLQMEVNYGEDWVRGGTESSVTVVVTVTDSVGSVKDTATVSADETGVFSVGCNEWDAGGCIDIAPGDKVYAWVDGATAEINQVGSITGKLDAVSDLITGTLDATWLDNPADVTCEIWEGGGPTVPMTAEPNGGEFVCNLGGMWDLNRGDYVVLRYLEGDGDSVVNKIVWPSAYVNYVHDWSQLTYELSHTVWVTVTDDLGSFKAGTSGETTSDGGWGGPGFSARGWWPPNPDIVPGDFVYFATDDGYANVVQVGDITGVIDVDNDNLAGTVSAGFAVSLTVNCGPWDAWDQGVDAPDMSDQVLPDGADTYLCHWDPGTEWDVIPGQQIGVTYFEPDGDAVSNSFREPAPYLRIWKEVNASAGVGGNQLFRITFQNDGDGPAENVFITDTFSAGFSYLSDTSGYSHSGTGPVVWDVGTLSAGTSGSFNVFMAVTGSQGDAVSNDADIATSTPYDQGDPSEKHAEWNSDIQANDTHLNVDISPWTGDPAPGEDFIYAVNVCNIGSTASTEVTLDEKLQTITPLQGWSAQHPGWYKVYSDPGHLILAYPSIPGYSCSEVYLRVNLDGSVDPGEYLFNEATISAANDLETNDNVSTWEGNAGSPHTNLWIDKSWGRGALVPGGEIHYLVQYGNSGNLPVGAVTITDTLPEGTLFLSAWHDDPSGGYNIVPTYQDADIVVWQIPRIDNGERFNFDISLAIDPAATPGSDLINEVSITELPGEDSHDDNVDQWVEPLYDLGPNLRISKYHNWNGTGQLGYNIFIENIGSETVNDLWITDTLPAGTTWGEWWDSDWDWSRFITITHDSGVLKWNYADIQPMDAAWIYFNANLDEASIPLRWFTNAVEITIPPGDPSPGDNFFDDVAFSGGEVQRAELWINQYGDSSMWGQAVHNYPITVTMPHGQYFAWADPGCDGCWDIDNVGLITPGITIIVEAGPALQPVNIVVPDPLAAHADSVSEEVSGQIGGWIEQNVEIHSDFGYQGATSDGAGNFLAIYDDIPRGGSGYIRFIDRVDYAEVIYHRPFYALELVNLPLIVKSR